MSALFSPITLRGLTLPNRIVVSPMCQYSSDDGAATDWHLIHLGGLALSGAGMLCIEATAVEPEGRITPSDLGLYDDRTEAALRRVLAAVRKYSRIPVAMQLAHAGRKASSHVPWQGGQLIPQAEGGWRPVAPSAVPQREHEPPPAELDAAGLARIREAFVATGQARGGPWHRCARDPQRARLSAARVPLADLQPPHRRVWRHPREPPALPARRVRGGARRGSRRHARRRPVVRRPTGSRAAGTSSRRASSPRS